MRERVLDSLRSEQREHATGKARDEPAAAGVEPGTMVDRTGELDKEALRVLNHDFMPLVDECYEQARERDPQLRGMLAVGVKLAGAEEIGGIIEDVEPAPRNEL